MVFLSTMGGAQANVNLGMLVEDSFQLLAIGILTLVECDVDQLTDVLSAPLSVQAIKVA